MKTIRLCPNCAAALPPDAPEGLCPQCLLKSTIASESANATTVAGSLPLPGKLFGGYRISRKLGEGGMGAVYEAEEVESGRRLALKVLSRAPESPAARQRFLREGRLAASVNHPNIVYIYGTEEIAGAPVITMEYVSGGTLNDRVKRSGPMAVADAVDATLQMVDGLEAAAAKGVLHRDVKPSNCFIDTDGKIKVGDFGLSISTLARDQTNLTVSGAIMGTPDFASPEQLRGDELDVRSDIYSVGVTLYYLLTGKAPFRAENMVNLLATVLEKAPPSPRVLRPNIPETVARIVLRCLAKQPAQRFKDYAALREALQPFSPTAPQPATLGLRFLAGIIDWVLWICVAHLAALPFYSQGNTRIQDWVFGSGLVLLQVLYFAIFESLWGASVGKWICRLRVVAPDRGFPSFWRALSRATLFELVRDFPQVLLSAFGQIHFTAGHLGSTFLLLNSPYLFLALCFVSARRRNGLAALHDLLTGTRVIERRAYEARPQLARADESGPQTSTTPMLGPFHVLDVLSRQEDTEILLAYDPRLLRHVWVRKGPCGTSSTPATQRDVARPGRLRWLAGRRSATACWDSYEAVPGQPLLNLLNRPQPWKSVRFWLNDVGEELEASSKDGSLPQTLGLDRLWITDGGRAKLLDFPAPTTSVSDPAVSPVQNAGELSCDRNYLAQFLSRLARASLTGCAAGNLEPDLTGLRPPLPVSAREFLESQPRKDLKTALTELSLLLDKPAVVSRARRLALLLGCILPPLVMLTLAWPGSRNAGRLVSRTPDLMPLFLCLNDLQGFASKAADPDAARKREAMELYIASKFRSSITNEAFWSEQMVRAMIAPPLRRLAEQAVTAHPAPTETEVQEASRFIQKHVRRLGTDQERLQRFDTDQIAKRFAPIGAFAWVIIPSLMATLVFRRGPLLHLLRIEIVTQQGVLARRWRTFLRCVFAWLPLFSLLVLYAIPGYGVPKVLLSFFVLGGAAYALIQPQRSLQDLLVRTWLVPK